LGDERVILAGGHSQILFVFNTTCGYCVATLPQWDALWRRFRRHPAVHVLGVSLHDDSLTQGYVRQHAIPYPVVRFPDERLMRMYRAMGVPLTLLLDTVGTVRYVRAGALSEAAVDSLLTEMRHTGLVLDVVSP
jgi:peroxiredoxin